MSRIALHLNRAKTIARVAGPFLSEQVHRKPPTDLSDVPASADEVTPSWLTAAVCSEVPGARVLAVEAQLSSKGSTQRSRLIVTYNEVGRNAGLPPTIFVKSTTSLASRVLVGVSGGSEGEWRFYSRVRPGTDILAPEGYYGASQRKTGRTILLLEDIARTRGATFGDCTNRYVTRPMAESLVGTLAQVHSCLFDSPRFSSDLRWMLTSEAFQTHVNDALNFGARVLVGVERAGDVLPARILRAPREIMPSLMQAHALERGKPMGLVHSDVHSGNWFATPESEMGLYDWQALAKGRGYRDLSYALMSNLTIEDRRAWERDLIALYTDLLAENGGERVTKEDAWLGYRQQTFHALGFWLYTIGAGRMEPNMQKTSVSMVNLERMGQAVVDLDSYGALSKGAH